MKTIYTLLLACLIPAGASAQLKIGGRTLDNAKLLKAAAAAATAIKLSDADIAQLSRDAVRQMDATNKLSDPSSAYSVRLRKLTEGITEADGLPLNFKVYETDEINAFACGDGSIRVFSALMDVMDDDQLMGIIGHEIGHVVHTDVKDAMKKAYLAQAAKGLISATDGKLAKITDSQLGDIVTAFSQAQFSQKQEFEADDYGFDFCTAHGFSPYGMGSSLEKLVELSNGAQSSAIQRMFSSHPDSAERARRACAKAEEYMKKLGAK